MLDLARLYECANGTKTINLVIKRNIEKFLMIFKLQKKNIQAF